jgi:hypothetical protein
MRCINTNRSAEPTFEHPHEVNVVVLRRDLDAHFTAKPLERDSELLRRGPRTDPDHGIPLVCYVCLGKLPCSGVRLRAPRGANSGAQDRQRWRSWCVLMGRSQEPGCRGRNTGSTTYSRCDAYVNRRS